MSIKGQGSFKLIVTGSDAFIKSDRRFWRIQGGAQADTIIDMVGNKWVTTTGEMAQVVDICDWEELTGDFDDEEEDNDDITEVTGTAEVDGQQTVTVSFKDEGDPGVAHVLASDPHYVVRIDVDEQGDLTLSDFNEPVEPRPRPPSSTSPRRSSSPRSSGGVGPSDRAPHTQAEGRPMPTVPPSPRLPRTTHSGQMARPAT